MERSIFQQEHELFRRSVRTFVKDEIVPRHAQWEKDGIVPRELWAKAGACGLLCMDVAKEYGGPGIADCRYHAIVNEELARAGATGALFSIHTDIVAPYISKYATPQQCKRWLPAMVRGESIGAIAITEPETGSDLSSLRTTAVRSGDHYVINGQKTFISNGILNDIVIVAARTDTAGGRKGISLLIVERDTPGYRRGRRLEKVGMHAQDTAELFFADARVPLDNLLGHEGRGLHYLVDSLTQERLFIAVASMAAATAAFEQTLSYCKQRQAFGQSIASFQHSRFLFAEMATELAIGQTFVDQSLMAFAGQRLTMEAASMAKWWTTELRKRITDQCLQLHGGNGYMLEYPIARAWLDARAATIAGGTTEIMKEIIGRSLES